MDDFEVCDNGAAESKVQQGPAAASNRSQAEEGSADQSTQQAASDNEAGASEHGESYATDDDQFSDVGEAPDTEVIHLSLYLQDLGQWQTDPTVAPELQKKRSVCTKMLCALFTLYPCNA